MAAALENFSIMQAERKMLILGDMKELGEASEEEHRKVVDYLRGHGFSNVWLVGTEFGKTQCAFRKFPDVAAVKAELAANPIEGCCILIKGSNGARLFELPEML